MVPLLPRPCDASAPNVTFGCVALHFFPLPGAVTWGALGDGNVTFPATPSADGASYSLSSIVTVPASGLGGATVQCQVDYGYVGTAALDISGKLGSGRRAGRVRLGPGCAPGLGDS